MTRKELVPGRLLAGAAGCSLLAAVVVVYAVTLHRVENERVVPTAQRAPMPVPAGAPTFDPMSVALASVGKVKNREAAVPPQCYTKTDGVSNPCWTCHTSSHGLNAMADWELQKEYAFSDVALTNHWQNLFSDQSAAIARITDNEILGWIREDNYTPLRRALGARKGYAGYIPDLDLERGFDEQGFARDGSGWRALRYKPFPGTFWPTNGSTDDVFVRLPREFRRNREGKESRDIYATNLAVLEAAIVADPLARRDSLEREIEPIEERASGIDLDGDGRLAVATVVRGLPGRYAGAARTVGVTAAVFPRGTEFLHSVRYVDPDVRSGLSRRMKELRYSRKVEEHDRWGIVRAYERELNEKDEGNLPTYPGSPEVGYKNAFGWQLQGFIEDERGRLRAQTEEEHLYCMGCHSTVGVTIDHTFAFARKVPGKDGWRRQTLEEMLDVPQLGHADPETLVYFRRVAGGDEFRQNAEVLERFFPGGVLDEAEVRRAAPGGDRDMTHLVMPSRRRALLLDKAYLALVMRQTFVLGRDAPLGPARNVHARIDNGETMLGKAGRVYTDGRLLLTWETTALTAAASRSALR
jgi:hypothetical protein